MKITKSSIEVRDIAIFARHGVYDEERVAGNDFLVNVALDYNAEGAMQYDDYNLALDYAQVVDIIKDVMAQPSALLENVTMRIISALVEAFPILLGGTVSVTKVNTPISTPTGGATFTASFTV